jgi:streptogramin lyase
MKANQIGRLVVTSTSNYSFAEYFSSTLAGGKPYGIVAVGSSVYFAQTANDKVTRFTPAGNSWIDIRSCITVCIPKEPYKLVLNSLGKVWGAERAGNRVSQYEYGTFPVIDPHAVSPTGSLPTGIAVDASDGIWFTQQSAGQIGRLNPSPPMTISYYALPQPTAFPSGIAADTGGWVGRPDPYQVFCR